MDKMWISLLSAIFSYAVLPKKRGGGMEFCGSNRGPLEVASILIQGRLSRLLKIKKRVNDVLPETFMTRPRDFS